ncbi:MAG: hypothetical protein U0230_00340 [Polyangiales bacterium]
MVGRRIIAWGFVGAVSLVGAGLGLAGAQTEGAGTEPAEGGSASVERRAASTPQEMIDEGEVIVSDGRHLGDRIDDMVDDARTAHDIIRVTCLGEKSVQVNGSVESAEQRLEGLRDAVQDRDADRSEHEYTLLVVLRDKFDVLEREAVQCAGQDVYETGTTVVTTSIDPGTPDENGSQVPPVLVPPPVIVVPPPASASM